ncbi:MAG: hypothetical protein KBG47_01035 [Bacteroidia bacterium]|jgi:hypothetical protein|nr:hypothetical protein [Sphingobacteriaceae bacterium]MBK7311974.1 hypothetical protein [Sphingobacteriaceae bacterium]MBK7816663.1 hypothetical protein [Sphingobacteriaceae bacterium]MBP9068059.1 hypothetical protein [Bacteroidia bacterium]
MKKTILALLICFSFVTKAEGNKYKLNDDAIDRSMNSAKEVSFDEMYAGGIDALSLQLSKSDGSKSRGGFLVRSFFCGGIALHRYYMGTTRGGMWAMYFCIPVVGWVNGFVDFWWSVFDGEAYKKYENNDKYIVWLD